MQDAIRMIGEIMQDFSGHWHQEIDAKFSCNRLLIVNDTEDYTMGHFSDILYCQKLECVEELYGTLLVGKAKTEIKLKSTQRRV